MIAFYAMGGGYGHLVRTQKVITALKINDYKVITSNPLVANIFSQDQFELFEVPTSKEALSEALTLYFKTNRFTTLIVDTFPNGILGELSLVENLPVGLQLIARRIIWKNYEPLLSYDITFDNAWQVEEFEEAQEQFMMHRCSSILPIHLDYSCQKPAIKLDDSPNWIIVHSFNKEEVEVLIHQAQDLAELESVSPILVVITDQDIPEATGLKVIHSSEANRYFEHATKIFSAAGFNTMQELMPYQDKHICIPFPRKYDDQFWRKGYMTY